MVFGAFDVLHKGHRNFFQQARKLAKRPFLIVSVARGANVKKIKGFRPFYSEKQRLAEVKKCKLVDKAVLGAKKDYIAQILKVKPSIIALGHDQAAYTKNLKQRLESRGLKIKIVRLKAFKRSVYRSSMAKKALNKSVESKFGSIF